MKGVLHKKSLVIYAYWLVLLCSALSLYFAPKYVVVTEPLLVPLLLLYLLLNDNNIGSSLGKLIFFVGIFLAFLGDVLQVVINNEIFFISSLVAFMLMNICYSISFFSMHKSGYRKPWLFISSCVLLLLIGYYFTRFIGDERLGAYKLPLILYICTLCIMVATTVNLTSNPQYQKTALCWLLPGALIFMIQNIFLAMNLFHLGGDTKWYVFSILPYGVAQYMMVKGVMKVYLSRGMNIE
jgi:uncharacterized membrane protein YhhN